METNELNFVLNKSHNKREEIKKEGKRSEGGRWEEKRANTLSLEQGWECGKENVGMGRLQMNSELFFAGLL